MAASKNVASRSALERALDKALDIPAARIEERIARMRHDRPGADNAELVEMAASRFRTEAGLSSGAVGASAAFPAVGAGTATALTIGQTAVFLASAVTYVLTVAELQGLRVIDTDKRRALVMSALLGREGSEAIQGSLGLTTLFWAAQYLAQMPLPTVKTINKELTRRMAKRMATKSGALALGRLIPFGIGAAIGWTGGRALANRVIEGASSALGPAAQLADHVDHAEVIDA